MNRPAARGWCPTVHDPMPAADGLLARVKPRVQGMTAAQLRAVADAAETYGSGRIELTSRANLQVRGLSDHGARRFAEAMVQAGLARSDPAAERRRNLFVQPGGGPELMALALETERWIESEESLSALPAKFGFALAETRDLVPGGSDIAVSGTNGWRIALEGSPIAAATADPLAAVQAVAESFLAMSAKFEPRPRRMKALVEAVGAEAIFADAGLERASSAPSSAIPLKPPVGPDGDAFSLGVAFGAADAAMARVAANLAERFGGGRIFLSAARAFRLPGVGAAHMATLSTRAVEAGFIVDPQDPRLAIHACVGRQGCERGQADVRADALALLDLARIEPGAFPSLHVSGCAKGCAHPRSAAITLVAADDGRGYNLVRKGQAHDEPSRFGLAIDAAADLLSREFSIRDD